MKHFARSLASDADSASWSSSVVTATSFVGCVIATMVGVLDALTGSSDTLACGVVAIGCAVSFALHIGRA